MMNPTRISKIAKLGLPAILLCSHADAAPLADGTVIGVDFGPTAPLTDFNQVPPGAAVVFDGTTTIMVDTAGVDVDGVGFAIVGGWSFSNDDSATAAETTPNLSLPAGFDDSVTTDWYGNNGTGTVQFTGLDDNLVYELFIGHAFVANALNGDSFYSSPDVLNAGRSFTNAHDNAGGNAYGTITDLRSTGGVLNINTSLVNGSILSAVSGLTLTASTPTEPFLGVPVISNVMATGADASDELSFLDSDVTLYWDTVDHGEDIVAWQGAVGSDGPNSEVAGPVAGTISGLSGDTQYFARFYATDTVGGGEALSVSTATFETPFGAGAIADLVATTQNALTVSLVWSDIYSSETSYTVERSISGANTWSTVGSLAADSTSFVDNTADDNTAYDYRVFATNSSGDSSFSNVSSATTPENIAGTGVGIQGTNAAIDGTLGTEGNSKNQAVQLVDGVFGVDGNAALSPDTFGDSPGINSYVGANNFVSTGREVTAIRVDITCFGDGGWFGPNNLDPGAGGALVNPTHLTVPTVQVTSDGGATWTVVDSTSNDYLAVMTGALIGGGGQPNPRNYLVSFPLDTPQTGINGIRLIGPEGGTASAGFLGAAEVLVEAQGFASQPLLTQGVVDLITPFGADATTDLTGSDADVTLYWDTVDHGDDLAAWGTGSSNDLGNQSVDTTVFGAITGLTEDTQYFSRFYAVNTVPEPDLDVFSEPTTAFVSAYDSKAVTDLAATALNAQQVRLTWSDIFNTEDSITVERSVDGAPYTVLVTLPANSETFTDSTTAGDTNYDYRVYASNEVSDSLESNVASVTTPSSSSNVAPTGTAILGSHNVDDGTLGTPWENGGSTTFLNDGVVGVDGGADVDVDTFGGENGTPGFGYAGVTGFVLSGQQVTSVSLQIGTRFDGGWFGPNALGPGGGNPLVNPTHLTTPKIQVSTDGGTTWTDVASTANDYISVMEGSLIGGGGGPNPRYYTVTFPLDTPQIGINGIRVFGSEGGNANNGFLAASEIFVNTEIIAGSPSLTTAAVSAITATDATAQTDLSGAPSDVTLYWDTADNGADLVAWQNGLGSDDRGLQPIGSVSGTISGLTEDTQYFTRFYAINTGPEPDLAAFSEPTTSFVTAFGTKVVSDLAASAPASDQVDLIWSDVFNTEVSITVERSLDGVVWDELEVLPANSTAYTDDTVAAETEYQYRVFATNANGDSTNSNVEIITTPALVPGLTTVEDWTFDDNMTPPGFTPVGTPAYADGQLVLDGTNYLTTADPLNGSTTNNVVEAIITVSSFDAFDFAFARNQPGGVNGGNNGQGLLLEDVGGEMGGIVGLNSFQGNPGRATDGTQVAVDTAVAVALVQNGVTTELYVNKVLAGTSVSGIFGTPDTLAIGTHPFDGLAGAMKGSIDRVRVSTFETGGFVAADLLEVPAPADDFSAWIDGFFPGETDEAIIGFDADPDGDGIDNGVENFFGTDPSASNSGIAALSTDGTTTSFTHPENTDPASDVMGDYEWSLDLVTWKASGEMEAGTTVTITATQDDPTSGTTTVDVVETGADADRVFLRVTATQAAP